jgi:pimeloyl-ACP methyl ester carboxylesterase
VDHEALVARARVHLHKARWFEVETPVGPVQAYDFAPASATRPRHTVLLIHGWTSEASFMAAFVEPLRQRGHRVLAFDFPAHGHSPGRMTNMVDCARALAAFMGTVGRIDVIVAHSVGALVSMMVAEGRDPLVAPVTAGRYALIAAPNQLKRMTDRFARHLGLAPVAQRAFEHRLERIGRRSLQDFSTASLAEVAGRPTLVIHSQDDDQIPFADAQEIVASCRTARLVALDGLGHARILYAPPVVRIVREFADLVDDPSSGR